MLTVAVFLWIKEMAAQDETPKTQQQEYAEKIAQELIKHLEKGTAPWQKPWSPADGNDLPHNPTTGNAYSGGNTLTLMMAMRNDPRWMTYKQAQDIGAQVRKGEKGMPIVKMITHKTITERDSNGKPKRNQDGETIKHHIKLDMPIFKYYSVFNGEQIDGLPEWERNAKEQDWQDIERAENILKASGANIAHYAQNRAFYRSSEDKIYLPHKEQFPSADNYYSTALHELGHWTGHVDRLDRPLGNSFGSIDYAKEELRAEIASMMLNRQLNLPHDPEQHASYVKSWIQVLKDEPTEILYAARDSAKIQDYIMGLAQQQQVETPKHPETWQEAKQVFDERLAILPEASQGQFKLQESQALDFIHKLNEDMQPQAKFNLYQNQLEQMDKAIDHVAKVALDVDVDIER
jgi:antirestriction protein ArdC